MMAKKTVYLFGGENDADYFLRVVSYPPEPEYGFEPLLVVDQGGDIEMETITLNPESAAALRDAINEFLGEG